MAVLYGLLPNLTLLAQGYTPSTNVEVVKMLSQRIGKSELDTWEIIGYASEVRDVFNIPISVTIAICLVESAGCQSPLCKMTNNCMGLTVSFDNWQGPVYCTEHEEMNKVTGDMYSQKVCFRVYTSIEACMLDFGQFISNERRWWYADAFNCPDFDSSCWIEALAGNENEIGYPTNWEKWKKACENVINAYNLKLLDQ